MSFPDYRRFTNNRQLFPRQDNYSSNRLICGHLNRIKFAPDITHYIKARSQGFSMRKSMAQASRCFCRSGNTNKKKQNEGQMTRAESKKLIQKLQSLEIGHQWNKE